MAIPATIWVPQPQNLEGEFSLDGGNFIIDPVSSSIFLIDPTSTSIFIIDPPTSFTPIASTAWVEDDTNE